MRKAALIIATALATASPALAGSDQWAAAEVNVFIGADLGYLSNASTDWTLDNLAGRTVFELDDGSGWQGSVIVGAEFSRDFALMLEGQYTSSDQDYKSEAGSASPKTGTAEIGFLGGFLTGHYRLPIAGKIRPYVGAGVGMGMMDVDDGDAETVFAYKALVGVDIAVGHTSSIYGEYNYLSTMEQDFDDGSGGKLEADLHANVVKLGFRQRF